MRISDWSSDVCSSDLKQKQEIELTATDIAKRLLDYGFHAPTVYFPLLVPECLLIEPTESEDRETLDAFIDALVALWVEAKQDIRSEEHTSELKSLMRTPYAVFSLIDHNNDSHHLDNHNSTQPTY